MESFVGQIALFPYSYTPSNWAACEGQVLPIQSNTGLYALIGTTYGGNGTTNFGLPDLRGRAPMCFGPLPGGATYTIGQRDGLEGVTLTEETTPTHQHGMTATSAVGTTNAPAGMLLAQVGGGLLNEAFTGKIYSADKPGGDTVLTQRSVAIAGASQPHNNMQPSLAMRYCICLRGINPPRS